MSAFVNNEWFLNFPSVFNTSICYSLQIFFFFYFCSKTIPDPKVCLLHIFWKDIFNSIQTRQARDRSLAILVKLNLLHQCLPKSNRMVFQVVCFLYLFKPLHGSQSHCFFPVAVNTYISIPPLALQRIRVSCGFWS